MGSHIFSVSSHNQHRDTQVFHPLIPVARCTIYFFFFFTAPIINTRGFHSFIYPHVWYVQCMCPGASARVLAYVCEGQRSMLSVSLYHSPLCFKMGFFIEPAAHCLARLDGQSVPGTISVHLPMLGLQESLGPAFYMGV